METFANLPYILRNGAEWYSAIGSEKSKGTKVIALTGKIKNTGLIEVPMGITLKEIIFEMVLLLFMSIHFAKFMIVNHFFKFDFNQRIVDQINCAGIAIINKSISQIISS